MIRIFAGRRFLRSAVIVVALLLVVAAALDVALLVNVAVQAYDTSSDPATAQYTWLGIVLYAVLLGIPAFLVTTTLVVLLKYLRRRLMMAPE